MESLVSLKDAREYLLKLPNELDEYLDDADHKKLITLLDKFEEFFNVVASIDQRTGGGKLVEAPEATEVGDYGFVLLLKLTELIDQLERPQKRREIEQIALVIARWTITYDGTINFLEPVVNAIAHFANLMHDKTALLALSDLITDIVDHCSAELKQDQDDSGDLRPWRLLHINRGIVATRTHDLEAMRQAFDEFLIYLPEDAPGFFAEGMKEMDTLDYPDHVREVMEFYAQQNPSVRVH